MRIATLQFTPTLGDVAASIAHAEELLSTNLSQLQNLDLLVLPELAFTGYNFPTLAAITPHLEPTASGPSTQWAVHTARRLGCTVAVGYPELESSQKIYNALVLVSTDGAVVAHYRKTHLYYSDEIWASEGQGFFGGEVPLGRAARPVQTAVGICMDINPYKFEAPWTLYEFANHARQTRARLVVLSCAWLTHLGAEELQREAGRPDLGTLSYWVERLAPLLGEEEEVVVVIANRTGDEGTAARVGDVRYAGSSCVMGMRKRANTAGEVRLWDILGRVEQGVLVVDTDEEPKYSLGGKGAGGGAAREHEIEDDEEEGDTDE